MVGWGTQKKSSSGRGRRVGPGVVKDKISLVWIQRGLIRRVHFIIAGFKQNEVVRRKGHVRIFFSYSLEDG